MHQTPLDARRAASLMFLRDGAQGLEVLMLRRAERDGDFRSGACVFPGGALDASDRQAHDFALGPTDAAASHRLALPEGGLDYMVAAIRESFEEVGLLLACDGAGVPVDAARHAQALAPWRARLQRGEASMAALCQAFGWRLDLRGLHYFSHWLTPPGMPKRFDTRFFTVQAPTGQQVQADRGEAVELMWLTPRAALDPERRLTLLPVTRHTLEELARHADAATAHAAAGARTNIGVTMPRLASTRRGVRAVMPDEHAWAEIGRLDPDGRRRPSAEIVAGVAVALSPRIIRVTAPNPGPMTGPGTNSYLVADAQGAPWTVIDPGPHDPTHLAALLAAAGGRPIERILTTHTHIDHSPGAAALAAATGATVIGRRAPPGVSQDIDFAPQREPQHGERIEVGATTTLRALHTPGHASNHVCWLLEQEKLLFTGDHVMQGSTVVINPPDGDMGQYLRALHALLDEDLEWLAPGHGFLVAQPQAVIRALVAHRMAREAKVLAALRAAQPATVGALLRSVYDDVPAALHPVAERSLLAHLLKLAADGTAACDDAGIWRAP